MIARIIADGTLAIEAENELETYALARWKEDFDRRRVTLKIVSDHQFPIPFACGGGGGPVPVIVGVDAVVR